MTVNLTGAILTGADLRGADLRGAVGLAPQQLEGAIIDETTLLPEHLGWCLEEKALGDPAPRSF